MKIHPLIQAMNISQQAKQYFNKLKFFEIIEDSIYISNTTHEVNECIANRWSFQADLEYCNINDILVFYRTVIAARTKYLLDNNINVKMIFYTWYEEISGNFYFSIIPQNWQRLLPDQELPFGCTINKVNELRIIVQNFIEDSYKGVIPIEEFIKGNQLNDDDYDDPKNYILNVWSIVL